MPPNMHKAVRPTACTAGANLGLNDGRSGSYASEAGSGGLEAAGPIAASG